MTFRLRPNVTTITHAETRARRHATPPQTGHAERAQIISQATRECPPAFTLIEVLVTIAILGLLIAILLPALSRARDQAKLTKCASSMRTIGQTLIAYAGDHRGRLPVNAVPWNERGYESRGTSLYAYGKNQSGGAWAWDLHRALGRTTSPWLADLRCPTAATTFPLRVSKSAIVDDQRPGSCWLLNAYCSGRMLSSIPSPASGVLVHESGLWESMSQDTNLLEFPAMPWRYPHPRVGFERAKSWEDWLPGRRVRPSRNILWCDGHVEKSLAHTWNKGTGSFDPDRIRHMRFGLPGDDLSHRDGP